MAEPRPITITDEFLCLLLQAQRDTLAEVRGLRADLAAGRPGVSSTPIVDAPPVTPAVAAESIALREPAAAALPAKKGGKR